MTQLRSVLTIHKPEIHKSTLHRPMAKRLPHRKLLELVSASDLLSTMSWFLEFTWAMSDRICFTVPPFDLSRHVPEFCVRIPSPEANFLCECRLLAGCCLCACLRIRLYTVSWSNRVSCGVWSTFRSHALPSSTSSMDILPGRPAKWSWVSSDVRPCTNLRKGLLIARRPKPTHFVKRLTATN